MLHKGSFDGLWRRDRCGLPIFLMVALLVLSASAGCGGSTTTAARRSETATAVPGVHGILYLGSTSQNSAGDFSSKILALRLADGTLLWHREFPGELLGATVAVSTLYVGIANAQSAVPSGTLMALSATTGSPIWQKAQSSGVLTPLAATADSVLVNAVISTSNVAAAPRSTIQALRASSGAVVWSTAEAGMVSSSATLAVGTLYLTKSSAIATSTAPPKHSVLSLDSSSGKLLWNHSLPDQVTDVSPPVLSAGVLYLSGEYSQGAGPASTYSSLIFAIRAADGTELWHTMPPMAGVAGPVVVAGQIVCYSYQSLDGPGGSIVGLHAADGTPAWQIPMHGVGPDPLAASNGALYTGEQAKSATGLGLSLQAYAVNTGQALFSQPLPTLSSPFLGFQIGTQFQVAAGSVVMVVTGPSEAGGTSNKQPNIVSDIVSLRASDGGLGWQQLVNGDVSAMVVAP